MLWFYVLYRYNAESVLLLCSVCVFFQTLGTAGGGEMCGLVELCGLVGGRILATSSQSYYNMYCLCYFFSTLPFY